MSKRKTIAVAIILALILLIGGMLAYFTDTDTKTNEFTLGKNVDIELKEDHFVENDAKDLHPNATVTKDPTIHNKTTDTPAYVFAEVVVPCYDTNAGATGTTPNYAPLFSLNGAYAQSTDANYGWEKISSSETANGTDKTITYVYAWKTSSGLTQLAGNATTTPVFSSVTLEPTLTQEQKATASATPNIVVNAYAIQTDEITGTPKAIYKLANPASTLTD